MLDTIDARTYVQCLAISVQIMFNLLLNTEFTSMKLDETQSKPARAANRLLGSQCREEREFAALAYTAVCYHIISPLTSRPGGSNIEILVLVPHQVAHGITGILQ